MDIMHDIAMEPDQIMKDPSFNLTELTNSNYSIAQAPLRDNVPDPPASSDTDVALLIVVATIGMIGSEC